MLGSGNGPSKSIMATLTKKNFATKKSVQRDVTVSERPRLQIDLTPQAFAHLSLMTKRANVKSPADVARNALRLYDWYLQKQEAGYNLLLSKGDEVKQVELLL
jgi:hypothetical protein